MSYAAMNASKVYQACHDAIDMRNQQKMNVGVYEENFQRLERLAILAHHVTAIKGDEAELFVSAEDFALIAGFWPNSFWPHGKKAPERSGAFLGQFNIGFRRRGQPGGGLRGIFGGFSGITSPGARKGLI